MIRKSYLYIFLAITISLTAQLTAYSQFAPVNGTVVVQKADGTKEPVAGALIEVYRVDVKGSFPSAKTNKKGEFNFAGMPFGAEYVFALSAPNCAPMLFPNVKAGQERLPIVMYPGDGHKLTEAEARKGALDAPKAGDEKQELSEEDKKAKDDIDKKNAEIIAKNEKMKNADATATKSNSEGYAALKAGNYDLAITKFNEGIEAVPDFVDSTPIMLIGKIDALRGKGFLVYKDGAALSDVVARRAKWDEANKSYDEGLAGFKQAMAILKGAEPATDPAILKRREATTLSLYKVATEIHRLKAVTGVDVSKIEEAGTVITDYIAMEPDPAKKIDAQMVIGDIHRRAGDFAKAVEAYRQVLAIKPDHAEATGQLGLSLFGLATMSEPENKEMEQEGLNYMQKYTEMAPVLATDSATVKELKESIKQTVDYLKSQKMAPQKVTTAPKKKN